MTTISQNSAALPTVPENTITGLKGIKSNLGSKLGGIKDMNESQKEQLANLKQLGSGLSEMGGNLITISENLGTMISYSDAKAPSIPTTQRTIDKMLYDDNGQLRSIFNGLITEDKYMTFIVKLKGNVNDTAKSNISASIKDSIKANPVKDVEVLLNRFTRKVISIKWIIILLALTTTGFGIWGDLRVGVETDIENFMPQNVQELKDIHKLRDVLGATDQISILISGENVLSENSLAWVDKITEALGKEFPSVVVETKSLTSVMRQTNDNKAPTVSETKDFIKDMPESQLKLLLNKEKSKGVITVGIKHLEAQELKNFIENLNDYISNNSSQELKITVTGKSVLDVEMMSALTTGRYKTTLLGMAAVFLRLLFIYRHPVKAFIPLLPIIFIVGWSGGIMYLFDIKYTPLTATLGALIIGIGTEFTILIM